MGWNGIAGRKDGYVVSVMERECGINHPYSSILRTALDFCKIIFR